VCFREAPNDSAGDVCAADLQEETVKPAELRAPSVSPNPTKTAATNKHRSERSEQSYRAPVRERVKAVARARERNLNKWVKLRSSMS
jgi:hypothetical protein